MKKQTIILGSGIMLVVLVAGGYWYFQKSLGEQIGAEIAKRMMEPYALSTVDMQAWTGLTIGMTKEEVIALLGDPPAKNKEERNAEQNYTDEELDRLEFWTWNYTYGLFVPVPHPKAYVVYFDQAGRISGFRAPTSE